jgi:hypothetical protein
VVPAEASTLQTGDLLHLVPMRVAVSSVVANGVYSPFDLVDGDVTTAWNSRTGDPRPSIEFRVPPGTMVERVRMTVGFTQTGTEGDYFTMNPRIKKVRVLWHGAHEWVLLREVTLDPESRALQGVPVEWYGGDFRIEVAETVAGTRKDWREVCISEMQVIGTRPSAMKPQDHLEVLVGSLDGTPAIDTTLRLVPLPTYASVADFCANDPLSCEDDAALGGPPPALPTTWPAGWKTARWITGTHVGPHATRLALAIETAGGRIAVLGDLGEQYERMSDLARKHERFEATTQAGWFVLITATITDASPSKISPIEEWLRVCADDRMGAPACSGSIPVGQLLQVTDLRLEPGANGIDWHDGHDELVWRFNYKLEGNVLTLENGRGKPDAEAAKLLGRHRLRP